jgi:hypothetical protein
VAGNGASVVVSSMLLGSMDKVLPEVVFVMHGLWLCSDCLTEVLWLLLYEYGLTGLWVAILGTLYHD